ncbi:unnamed protein product [Clonostachys rhizophaga]|uniref:Uncharacterized protein n=1 Tax=Clonostachys rhizophaga TaxID=160324 RepID=A0A9N9V071_9HYPO|nr:unnamed protein product [Clonostachys rhizophaga]
MNTNITINLPRPSPATISTGTPNDVKKHWVRQYQHLMTYLDKQLDKKQILYMITASLEWDLVDMTDPSEILAFLNVC